MTLMVRPYMRDPVTGEEVSLGGRMAPPRNELGGFECWRTEVYGSAVAKALGLRLLPSLTSTDIYAEGEDLDRLRQEAEMLRAHAHQIHDDPSSIYFRLDNLLEAIGVAMKSGDPSAGVYLG